MELSVQIEIGDGLSWERWKRIVPLVDRLGYRGLYICDHFYAGDGYPDSVEIFLAFAYLATQSARLEFGSDAPVAPLDPWDGIASAVSRTDDDRPGWHPEQCLSLETAVAASTGGRTAVRLRDPADLVLVGRDIAGLPPSELRDLPITATVLDGRLTFRA